jgi:hypothetical protein
MSSDFPGPNNTDIFSNQKDVYHYLESYVENFALSNYTQFNSCFTQVKKKESL